jgi:hypothetical protein
MAYSNNITPGRPPLLWSDVNEAFSQINENFTILASVITRSVPYEIANIDLSNPVRIVLVETHPFENGDQATILNSGISQLDNNIYYVKVISQDELELYEDEILSLSVNGAGYDSYSSGGGQIQGLTPLDGLDFSNFRDDLIPNETATYQLGSPSKTWKRLYIQEWADIPGSELNGLWLGAAQIRGIGTIVDLPSNSTVNGDLIIDPDKTFFKSVQVDNGNRVVADSFADTLNLNSGTAMQLVVDSAAESVTINNIGVTALSAGTAIGVSSSTGNITVSNTGVTSLSAGTAVSGRTAGAGISVSAGTGAISITNTGVLQVQQGFGITVSTDTVTGIVTISNAAPAQVTFRTISVSGSPNLVADSTSDTLVIEAGYGMIITTDETTDDKLIITFDQNTDIKGSVFGDDSTLIVDAVDNRVYASNGFFGNLTGNVTGNVTGNADSSTVSSTVNITDTNGLTTIYYPTFVENRTTGQTVRADVDLSYRTDTNTLTVPNIAGNLTGTVTGNIFTNLIDSADSSAITVTPAIIFSSDVTVENDLDVTQRLRVQGSRVINLAELQAVVAASIDFADFQTRIAALA